MVISVIVVQQEYVGVRYKKMKIKCAGRYAGEEYECEDGFVHNGKWDDKELIVHQKLEEEADNKHDYWLGFLEIKK